MLPLLPSFLVRFGPCCWELSHPQRAAVSQQPARRAANWPTDRSIVLRTFFGDRMPGAEGVLDTRAWWSLLHRGPSPPLTGSAVTAVFNVQSSITRCFDRIPGEARTV